MRLFTVDVGSTDLQYEALSYTWGGQSDVKYYVYVNGFKQSVTPNLHSALSSLRHPSRGRMLWVDSICINQADVQERFHQVSLMARIYTSASKVIVYLGAATPATDTLFKMDKEDDKDNEYDVSIDPMFWKLCHEAGPDLVAGFIDVCSRIWWSRVWILQEYTLNKSDPVLYCGRANVHNVVFYQQFGKLYNWVRHKRLHPTMLDLCRHPACNKTMLTSDYSEPSNIGAPRNKGKENEVAESHNPRVVDPKGKLRLLPTQNSPGREWVKWGSKVWKANSVMARRDRCSPFSDPYLTNLGLQSQCTDLHDVVYGLRELMVSVVGTSRTRP
ncbi:HET domain-containing protein [Paraphaeosphaeria sporulosa]